MQWHPAFYAGIQIELETEGLALGKAEGIITLLKDLGEVSEKLQRNIMEQNDTEVLDPWIRYAARAKTIEDFEQKYNNSWPYPQNRTC